MDLSSAITGLTFTSSDLASQVERTGFRLKKVQYDKKTDRIIATAENPSDKREEEGWGRTDQEALANLLVRCNHLIHMRSTKIAGWSSTFTSEMGPIAEAYSKAPIYEPKAAIAFMELGHDAERRARALTEHLEILIVNNPEPYPSAEKMSDDIRKRRKLEVSKAGIDHPIWSSKQVIAYRICTDVLGYAASGGDFGWEGTNQAFADYAALLPFEAQKALFAEMIAPAAYAAYYRSYGPQKIALFPKFMDRVQEKENPHKGFPGVHPSQISPPVAQPHLKQNFSFWGNSPDPAIEWPQNGLGAVLGAVNPGLRDPNEGWQSGVSPLPVNAYLHHDDPIQAQAVTENAGLINTEWERLNQDDPAELETMKSAIVNAFRVVLLSPRKDLRWNCHDDQTEALTDRGWLSLRELQTLWGKEEFKVATYHDGLLAYEIPTNMTVQPYRGKLVAFKGRYLDILVTPNHRMLTADGQFINADKIPIYKGVGRGGYGPLVPTAGIQEAKKFETFTLPGCDQREPKVGCVPITDRAQHPDRKIPMDTWLSWLGWYISEGWIDSRRRVHISQDMSSLVLAQAQAACDQLGMGDSHIQPNNMWVWSSRAPYTEALGLWVNQHIGKGARNKRLPGFVFDLSAHQSVLLLHALLMGDGTANAEWTVDQGAAFYTSSMQLAKDTQRLAIHCGLRSIVSLIRPETNEWKVSINPGKPTRLPRPQTIPYDGIVWCFTMPSGTMLTRRNGRVAITGNSVHYQDIAHIPGGETDPTVYWHALENARQNWNVKRYGEGMRYAHRPYGKLIPKLEQIIYQRNPKIGFEAAKDEAMKFLFRQETRFQDQVMEEDADVPEAKQKVGYQIENEANKRMAIWLKTYIAENQKGMDMFASQESLFDMSPEAPEPNPEPQDMTKYGAFMGTHLKAIAQVSQHVNEILKAALEDVHMHDATGHHFRSVVLQLKVSGVGPKVCSFAWLLLQPLRSELATIDTHMMDVLGHNFEKEMNNRDYFKYERELAAGRDASGYGAMPLGQFQWGMWDHKRTGPGSHQDHRAMAVLPNAMLPHESIDWAKKEQPIGAQGAQEYKENWLSNAPDWWQNTADARTQVADDFDQGTGYKVPQNQIPFQGQLPVTAKSKSKSMYKQGASMLAPHLIHPETGERLVGPPGLSIMQHARNQLGLTTPQVWQQLADEAVGKS
jgi:hypothetical protein